MTSPPSRLLCVVRRLGKGRKENAIFIGIPSGTCCGGESSIRASLTPFMHQTARNCPPCLVICLLSIKFFVENNFQLYLHFKSYLLYIGIGIIKQLLRKCTAEKRSRPPLTGNIKYRLSVMASQRRQLLISMLHVIVSLIKMFCDFQLFYAQRKLPYNRFF